MATSQLGDFVQHLRRAVLLDNEAGPTDGQLLKLFVDHGDEDAFAALVRKHGPMVWGVCHRLLHRQDAEDAFQATFLVLVRKAASVTPREMVANWLYGVAHRTALKARATVATRKRRERQVTEMPEPAVEESDLWSDLRPLIDQELSRLPDKYRAVIVLCELEGKTRKEAGRQLGIPEGTVASRLNRGRTMLAERLSRLGIPVSGIGLATVLSRGATAATVPPSLLRVSIRIAHILAGGGTTASSLLSAQAVALSEGVINTMITKTAIAPIVVLALVAGGLSGGAISRYMHVLPSEKITAPTTQHQTRQAETKKQSKTADFDLTSSSDVIAVDLTKRIVTGKELLGSNATFRLMGDRWKLSVGPTTQIIIDGKKSQLEDLKNVVGGVGPGHFIRVNGEWEFEVLRPSHSLQTGQAKVIEVKGPPDEGVVEAVDVGRKTVTISGFKVTGTHRMAGATVNINGKAAGIADLRPNMHASFSMSAVRNAPDATVTAMGPKIEAVIKTVNTETHSVGVRIPGLQITADCVPVAADAKVLIDGKDAELGDLKAGMHVTLQMCARRTRA